MNARAKTTDPGPRGGHAPQRRGQRLPTRSPTLVVAAVSLAAPEAIAGGLAAQMAAGGTPALGAKPGETAAREHTHGDVAGRPP